MEMNLEKFRIAHGQQAVSLEMLGDVLNHGFFRKLAAFDEHLCIKFEFQHENSSFEQ